MTERRIRRTAVPCIGRHRLAAAWELRPPLIGQRVEWLYWQTACERCAHIERRWFRVEIPAWFTLPRPGRRAIPVARYLERLRITAPDPETLSSGVPDEIRRQVLGMDG